MRGCEEAGTPQGERGGEAKCLVCEALMGAPLLSRIFVVLHACRVPWVGGAVRTFGPTLVGVRSEDCGIRGCCEHSGC